MPNDLTLDDVDRFLADRAVQSAMDASRDSRPLQICYPSEVPLSRFLAWLFDPTQGHCLNTSALRALLTACWENGTPPALSQSMRDRIAPTALAHLTLADVIIEREVVLTEDSGRLDVLVIVPAQKLLIAIENKTGARQSVDQLERYRTGLKKRFKGWDPLLVFLDMYGAEPNDDRWIPLQYDWLIDELCVAEKASWLGEEPRRSISEFRRTLDRFGDTEIAPGLDETSLLAIVNNHQAVFRQMRKWIRERESTSSLAAHIYRNTAAADPALQALFPVYSRRKNLWHRGIPMIDYAVLRIAAEARFKDLSCDAKHTGSAYFTLKRWEHLAREDARYWPFNVCVWEHLDAPESERFVIESNAVWNQVADEHKPDLLGIVKAIRSRHKDGTASTGSSRPPMRVTRCSSRETAAVALCEHLQELADSLGGKQV